MDYPRIIVQTKKYRLVVRLDDDQKEEYVLETVGYNAMEESVFKRAESPFYYRNFVEALAKEGKL